MAESGCEPILRSIRMAIEDKEETFTREVLAKAGCKMQQTLYPSEVSLERRMIMLSKGQIDLIIGVNKRPDREKYAHFSVPFEKERVRLWTRKGLESSYQGDDLTGIIEAGAKILAPDAGWYGPDFERIKEIHSDQIIYYTDVRHGMVLLHKNRADVLLGSEHFEQYFQEKYKNNTLRLPQIVYTDQLRLMYSKKTVSLSTVERIDRIIVEELARQHNALTNNQ